MRGHYHSISSNSKVFLFFILLLIGLFVGNSIGLLGSTIFNASSMTDLTSLQTVKALKFLQAFSAIGIFIIPAFLFSYVTNFSLSFTNVSRQQILITVVLMLMSMPIINVLAEWNASMHLPSFLSSLEEWMRLAEVQAMRITDSFLNVKTISGVLFNLLIIAVIPAIGEEVLFRGVIQNSLYQKTSNIHLSIWLSAFLFSAMHLQFMGFIPRFLIGGMFGYLFYWSGSIWLPIIAHFVNNAVAVILSFLVLNGQLSKDVETMGANDGQVSVIIIAFMGLSLLLYFLKVLPNSTRT
ncbi:MAG: CPBP family intramembrane glutamic endopeptidase [Flavobacteriales bacterium]